jgi:hypothetical protein
MEADMKRAMLVGSSAALALALMAVPAPAQTRTASSVSPESVVYDAASAMAFLKSLSGDWEAGARDHHNSGAEASGGSGSTLTFRTKAAGSAVVQTTGIGTRNEMETIFHMDGGKLLLTHYCALQNAPVLRFQKSAKPGEIKFVFDGGTNFDPAVDAHFHEGTFRVINKDTVEQNFTVFSNGKPSPEGKAVLRRKLAN